MRTLSNALITAQQNTLAKPYNHLVMFLDSGIDTDEPLDLTETGILCDADATTAIPVGSIISIANDSGYGNELMKVTGTGTTLTVTRGALGSTAAVHATNKDICISTDYSSKLLFIERIEEMYRDQATTILRNNDRAFDYISMEGRMVRIAYGHTTNNAVVEPDGDNSTNEYSYTPELWVKSQMINSVEGESVCQIYCEGCWYRMRETKFKAYGTAPYYQWIFENTHTIYELLEMLIEDVMGWTLNPLATSDGIVDVFKPWFRTNAEQPENVAEVVWRLISMTKSYIRVRANHIFDIIYPQNADSANETFYSYQVPYFKEYIEKVNALVPNTINVLCNKTTPDSDPNWQTDVDTIIVGTATDASQVAKYGDVLDIYIEGKITNQTDADLFASAILTRIMSDTIAGQLIIPHDAGMELYDKVSIVDSRGFQ